MVNFKGTFSELLEYFYWTFSEPNALFYYTCNNIKWTFSERSVNFEKFNIVDRVGLKEQTIIKIKLKFSVLELQLF